MSIPSERFGKECPPRELRRLCHKGFWCGEDRVHAINLSSAGMCFRVDRRMETGEIVTLHHGPGLQVKARIAWVRRLAACSEVGVEFHDLKERIQSWQSFLGAEPDAVRTDSGGQPILALPAPGQTFRPVFSGARIQLNGSNAGTGPGGSGRTWRTAMKLMGPSNGNSAEG